MTISDRLSQQPHLNEHVTAINFVNGGAQRNSRDLQKDAGNALRALWSTTNPGSGLGASRAIAVTGKGNIPYVIELDPSGGGMSRVKVRTPRMKGVQLAFMTTSKDPFTPVGVRVETLGS